MMLVSNWHFVIRVEIRLTKGHRSSGLSVFVKIDMAIGNTLFKTAALSTAPPRIVIILFKE